MERPAETTFFRYPGPGHILRYARLAFDGSREGHVEGLLPALGDLCDPGGAVRLGALALLVDYGAGMLAMQSVRPDWTVTHDMALHLTGLAPAGGELASRCRLVRAGRNTVISETSVAAPDGGEIARAYVTFTRLARRHDTPRGTDDLRVNLAEAGERPRVPLDEAIGFRFSPPSPGSGGAGGRHWVEFEHEPFIHNSLGAIQGGVVTLALERGGSWAGEQELGRPCRTVDLHLHYLALGKHGPFRARAEVLRRTAGQVVSRVDLVDTGNEARVLALGVATAEAI
jgi:acyl-coenzyme A thioesterase PaaI-like protein